MANTEVEERLQNFIAQSESLEEINLQIYFTDPLVHQALFETCLQKPRLRHVNIFRTPREVYDHLNAKIPKDKSLRIFKVRGNDTFSETFYESIEENGN